MSAGFKGGHRDGSAECPLYPQKRTLVERLGMSALCHKRTHAVQQIRFGSEARTFHNASSMSAIPSKAD